MLNTQLLAKMVNSKRGPKGLREVASEIGDLSTATLSRIEQGKVPDVETFIKICKWLGVPTSYFTDFEESQVSNKEKIVAHLRADRLLSQDTQSAIIRLIELAYNSDGK